jgi:hypothetical protein
MRHTDVHCLLAKKPADNLRIDFRGSNGARSAQGSCVDESITKAIEG